MNCKVTEKHLRKKVFVCAPEQYQTPTQLGYL